MLRRGSVLALLGFAACSVVNAPADVELGPGENGHCTKASDCSALTADACNVVACQNQECVLTPANEGAGCDDGDFCTVNDVCTAGKCGGDTRKCPDPDACHTATCDEASQACKPKAGHDGATCEDGNKCHLPGTCSNGACSSGGDKCASLGTECSTAVCDSPEVGCSTRAINEGGQCDVTNTCATSVCMSGACVGTPVAGTDGDVCDDGKWCTVDERCKNGVCTPSTSSSICPPDQGCGKWTCDEAGHKCTPDPMNEGMSCSFGSCSQGGTCSMGTCETTPTESIYFFDDFSNGNSQGWTLDGDWMIGVAARSSGGTPIDVSSMQRFSPDPDEDHTPQTFDNMLAGVNVGQPDSADNAPGGIGNADVGDPTLGHGFYYLTSPVINTAVAPGQVELSFYRWLNSDYPPFMSDTIDVTTDGMNWTSIFANQNGVLINDSHWTIQTYDLTAFKSSTLQIRFGYATEPGVYTVGSWNVDDVLIADTVCP